MEKLTELKNNCKSSDKNMTVSISTVPFFATEGTWNSPIVKLEPVEYSLQRTHKNGHLLASPDPIFGEGPRPFSPLLLQVAMIS